MSWSIFIALLLILGLVLFLIEVLIIPGFGIAGIGAIIFLTLGILLAWVKLTLAWAIGVTLLSAVSLVAMIVLARMSGLMSRFVLSQRVGGYRTGAASRGRRLLSASAKRQEEEDNQMVEDGKIAVKSAAISEGQIGQAISDLRPAGIAKFGDRRLHVLTDGTYIKKGTRVKIIRIEGSRIVVEEEQ
ncbi:MAG: hypothetical protein K6U11_13865 [bacterium]|nr:hypothetical protein [bacterium]